MTPIDVEPARREASDEDLEHIAACIVRHLGPNEIVVVLTAIERRPESFVALHNERLSGHVIEDEDLARKFLHLARDVLRGGEA